MASSLEFQVRKDAFVERRIVELKDEAPLTDGQLRLHIERFGFSANNITYAAVGHRIGYWKFFPPSGEDAQGWGLIPVWGFAEVAESKIDNIQIGERIFGYFPPASTLIVKPTAVSASTFVDGSPHRSELPAGYNIYRRVAGESDYKPERDNERMLLWPLLITSFCLWDSLQQNRWYGAKQLVIVSASSKTGIGLAYAAHADAKSPKVIGLTSPQNLKFVDDLAPYDSAAAYNNVSNIDCDKPTVIVDMSGNASVLGDLYKHLGDNMMFCLNVGLTHWENTLPADVDLRERSRFFFAPDHIAARISDWGPQGFAHRTSEYIADTTQSCSKWLQISTLDGLPGLADVFEAVCDGDVAPNNGLIVQLSA